MNLIKTFQQGTKARAETQKEIGKLVLYCDHSLDELTSEEIQITVERNGQNNISITKSFVNLRQFLLACTYGFDAIGSFPGDHYEPFKTVATIELSELGNLELLGSDKIIVELNKLNNDFTYVIDGISVEDTTEDDSDIYIYEEKRIPKEQIDYTIVCDNFDTCVIQDDASIKEVNITHANKQVTKHTMRELRATSQDNDPLALINQDGKVACSYVGYLQLDCKRITHINVVKDDTKQINVLFRHDVQMKQLGLI
jgi:hypothetical protein